MRHQRKRHLGVRGTPGQSPVKVGFVIRNQELPDYEGEHTRASFEDEHTDDGHMLFPIPFDADGLDELLPVLSGSPAAHQQVPSLDADVLLLPELPPVEGTPCAEWVPSHSSPVDMLSDDVLHLDADGLAELLPGSPAAHQQFPSLDASVLPIPLAEPAELPPVEGTPSADWVPSDISTVDMLSDDHINIAELGLAGSGAHGCPGESLCLFCLAYLPPGPFNKKWMYNVQHPGAAVKFLSSRPNPRSGKTEQWTVQLRPRWGQQLRLQSDELAPWFVRKVDCYGRRVRRPAI